MVKKQVTKIEGAFEHSFLLLAWSGQKQISVVSIRTWQSRGSHMENWKPKQPTTPTSDRNPSVGINRLCCRAPAVLLEKASAEIARKPESGVNKVSSKGAVVSEEDDSEER